MASTANSSDQTVENITALPAAVAKEPAAAEISDHGGDSACWADLVCPECGAISSEGDHRGCESEQVS
jgi:hypothetical protein